MRYFLFSSLLFFKICTISAQGTYPTDYFRSPVATPITLAGNFGEIRPNHFHAGFDIRTNNKEGALVFAVAEGYVSRIRISPVGYGNALYITHPNGYVSVYGHLRNFNPAIQAYAKAVQSFLQSFEIDTLLVPGTLPVNKSDIIAFSGNTGGSQAPHLHFEIRDEKTEMPINPYYFGFQVKDHIRPTISSIVIYPLGATATVNGKQAPKKLIPVKIKDAYLIAKSDSIHVNGEIGFGINCFDKENGSSGPNGVYSIELQESGKRLFYYEMEKFTFDNARYVNAHIDYAEKQRHHQVIQKCFLSKNNLLEIYKDVKKQGTVHFQDDSIHWIKFIVKDFEGNKSELSVKVKSSSKTRIPAPQQTIPVLNCLEENQVSKPDITVFIPANALYDDLAFVYKKTAGAKTTFSDVHHLADETIGLQKAIVITMNASRVPDHLKTKACIVSMDKGKFNYEGGALLNGSLVAESKHFGNFAIAVDTVPPKITTTVKPLPGDSIANFSQLKSLRFIVTDNLSGVKKYRATIDGKWVVCAYDAKNDLLTYTFEESPGTGLHYFKLVVSDDRDNSREWKIIFKK